MSAFSSASTVFASVISILALLFAVRTAIATRGLLDQWTQFRESLNSWQRSCSQESFELRIAEIEATLATVSNRVKMQRVRAAAGDTSAAPAAPKSSGLPDPYTQPDEWRKAVNARLARGKFGL